MATKIKPNIESQTVFENLQFTKPADGLIEAIKQHSERVLGRTADAKYIKETVNRIVEDRLNV